MEILRLFSEPLSKKNESLLQAYKDANEIVSQTDDIEAKINAYNNVINFCMGSAECKYDASIKRNKILFWAYSNMADLTLYKNTDSFSGKNLEKALKFYASAFTLSANDKDKERVLQKMANVYKEQKDTKKWLEVSHKRIAYLENFEKREACVFLAADVSDLDGKITLLEHALSYVNKEDVSVYSKCRNTVEICEALENIYLSKKDDKNLKRIRSLAKKTADLLEHEKK